MRSGKKKTFGGLLKKLRLEEAKIGLRSFAELIEWKPSNLSNLERGRIRPPANKKTIDMMCNALGLAKNDSRRIELYDLAAKDSKRIPADITEAVQEQPGIPVLVRSVANKQLSEKKIRELAKYIRKHY